MRAFLMKLWGKVLCILFLNMLVKGWAFAFSWSFEVCPVSVSELKGFVGVFVRGCLFNLGC